MKKLIFDLTKTQPIGNVKFHGGGKYGEIVFEALVRKSKNIIAYYNSTIWLNPEVQSLCQENDILIVDSATKTLSVLVKEVNGVVYSPIVGDMSEMTPEITYITTIHGLRNLEFPIDKYVAYFKKPYLRAVYGLYQNWKAGKEFSSTLKWYREVFAKKNVHIVTVSEHSKSSILSFAPSLKPEEVEVFYSPSTISEKYNEVPVYSADKYYLLVSGNRWVKNAFRGVAAFDEIFSERPEFTGKVIVTGVSDESVFLRQIKNKDRFLFLNYVDEETLFSLYKGAFLFVYPSLNEGFGYPPIEAMTQGVPIIASAISSIPEVCGDAVLYFNPLMVSEIKMRILQMEDQNVRTQFTERAKLRLDELLDRQQKDLDNFTNYILSYLK